MSTAEPYPGTHPLPGVGVAVVEQDRILLVERGRQPGKGLWAVPGGKVRLGEPLQVAARREVQEETGIQVRLDRVIWVGESIGPGDPPEWHYTLIDYLGFPVGGRLAPSDDAADARWVPLTEVGELPLTPTMPPLIDVLIAELAAGKES